MRHLFWPNSFGLEGIAENNFVGLARELVLETVNSHFRSVDPSDPSNPSSSSSSSSSPSSSSSSSSSSSEEASSSSSSTHESSSSLLISQSSSGQAFFSVSIASTSIHVNTNNLNI
ncbi:hypothetical protein O181_001809 [Austropuccinia psidii MF-1]|uniref:Uncharacterized protein n=1 Tax=Austropuccinia psidii MF-1 TaxID=1389203 RepID=A0A9Q3BBA1_9BASI|nr:hypothetical protein [Austropuccinia psidii MF-1]